MMISIHDRLCAGFHLQNLFTGFTACAWRESGPESHEAKIPQELIPKNWNGEEVPHRCVEKRLGNSRMTKMALNRKRKRRKEKPKRQIDRKIDNAKDRLP